MLGDRSLIFGFAIFLTMPTAAHASGGDVLGLLWAQAGLFLVVVVSLFVVRLSSAQKSVVFSAYLISGIVANYATLNLPYSENAILIDSVSTLVPLLVWIVALGYFVVRRGKKRNRPLHPILGSGAPPSPDTSVRFGHVNEEEVECFYSSQQQYRAVISRDPAGRYRIRRERWNTGDWDIAKVAFWCDDDAMVTITDTLENARKLAAERLSEVPDALSKNDV
jgi:hypothetical protein